MQTFWISWTTESFFIPKIACRLKRRKTFMYLLSLVLVFILYEVNVQFLGNESIYKNRNVETPCVLPKINPFDPSILQYIWKPRPVVCDQKPSLAFINESSFVHLNYTAIKSLGLENVMCSYRVVKRKGDFDIDIFPEVNFLPPTYLPAEVVIIKCYEGKGRVVYNRVHMNVDYRRILQDRNLENETEQQLSVYIFGFDSVSALNAERKLTKTLKYLRDDLHGYVFKGHTKIGENTFPNMVALLRGMNPELKPIPWNVPIKNSLLWKNFSEAGYVTFYSEDAYIKEMTTFRDFVDEQPTDHYIKPFYLALGQKGIPFLNNALHYLDGTPTLCYGDKLMHKIVIEYLERLFHVYENRRKFLLSWQQELTHGYLNLLDLADNDVYEHFKKLKNSGRLKNTILILMSDHGFHATKVRNTAIGRVEARMPLFAISVPQHLISKYPHIHQALHRNTQRLTTHFDVYATLVDILKGNYVRKPEFSESDFLPQAISLFQEIPKRRTCFLAGINEHYCPCYTPESISIRDSRAIAAADFVVGRLNADLLPVRHKCAVLSLDSIDNANIIKDTFVLTEKSIKFSIKDFLFGRQQKAQVRILVVVKVAPSHGLFEATVSFTNKGDITLLGEISRINMYGKQSRCIDHRILRKSCFCI